ncbi:MAG: class I SAM-dependent methyltransferase [Melioribacteraceae bacterium]|nr:class I SAM-dependent methyltransferase [Melioribacteraceae bacterium]MCF8263108.1 class I SAM-dependent methyltransferase [Melioribacteraceae bacterium]MCF8413843.1 class I SAM-dependent methyltransferase [Melioribacteraceae bacterium]MCF8430560.1 class I SAM-dependent methyltransferase [Melioribacteraceae bacterium]
MAENFYRHAKAYDIAFSDREYKIECDFLEWAFQNHGRLDLKLNEKNFLELGAGPAQHAREMAKRGWNSTALDLSPDMLKYADDESRKEGLVLNCVVADMSEFKLNTKFQLAATLMESISHLVTNEQIISHFKSVAESLIQGGVYVIEATHPMFFFPDNEPNTWHSKNEEMEVEVTFGNPDDFYDSITQQWTTSTIIKIKDGDKSWETYETKSQIRWYLAQEMKALIELSGDFELCYFYGSLYSLPPQNFDHSEKSDAMVIVLKKK